MFFRQNSDAPVLPDEPSSPPNLASSSSNGSSAHVHLAGNELPDSTTRSFVARAEEPVETAVSRSRRSVPKAAYAIVPSVLFLGLALATRSNELAPTSSTRSGTSALQIEGRNAILAASQTMIVPATTASATPAPNAPLTLPAAGSVVWRARLQPVVDVVGRAPMTGQITRVWARTGQNVSVGDRVLRILSYSNNIVAPAPQRRNNNRNDDSAAEEEQVQATRAQGELGTRLSQAQARLKLAQSRVTRAQSRVDEAMSVVRKLQSGDASATDESDIEYSLPEADAPQKNPSGINAAEVQAAQATAERASQAAQNARDEAVDAERSAARAESDAQDKSRRARELQQTRDASKAAIAKATKTSEPTNDATSNNAAPVVKSPVAKPEAPSVSAGAVAEAESSAREAASRASGLRGKANAAKSVADKAESRAQVAAGRAKESLRSLQLFNDDAPAQSAPRRRTSTRSSKKLPSVAEASRMVREATTESRAASREAERWETEVDAYSRQARQTQQRLAASEQNLGSSQQQEQQQELDTTLQRNLSIVRAPANGAIVQIGDVGDNVSFGDPILMVGKTGVLRAQFSDTSGLWRKLKRGSILPATVSMPNESVPQKVATSSTRSSVVARNANVANASANAIPVNAIAVVARVEEVEAPSQKGAPALVKTTVRTVVSAAMRPTDADNAANAAANADNSTPKPLRLRAGMTILCSVDGASIATNAVANRAAESTENGAVVLPQEAVVLLDNLSSSENASEVSANVSQSMARVYVAVLRPDENGSFGIEWREVQTQVAASPEQRLVRGLAPGERVALNAAALRELTLNYGDDAKVIVRDNVQRDAAPEELK